MMCRNSCCKSCDTRIAVPTTTLAMSFMQQRPFNRMLPLAGLFTLPWWGPSGGEDFRVEAAGHLARERVAHLLVHGHELRGGAGAWVQRGAPRQTQPLQLPRQRRQARRKLRQSQELPFKGTSDKASLNYVGTRRLN